MTHTEPARTESTRDAATRAENDSSERQHATAILYLTEWMRRERDHLRRVKPWTTAYRERAARGELHPVYDFLWRYYSLRPSQLERWHPGIGIVLQGEPARHYLSFPGYVARTGGVAAAPATLTAARRESVTWIARLLEATANRPPQFGCFGLHEWAMVYRSRQVRHAGLPLRLSEEGIAQIVESLPVCCTHFDAFRFFAAGARPLNRMQPTREAALELEQRGCIHVTMDLYKWAYKLVPFVPSELIADAFELALRAREIDMRASPYDLQDYGFTPLRIETAAGRSEYVNAQQSLAEATIPLRTRLLEVCRRIERETS